MAGDCSTALINTHSNHTDFIPNTTGRHSHCLCNDLRLAAVECNCASTRAAEACSDTNATFRNKTYEIRSKNGCQFGAIS